MSALRKTAREFDAPPPRPRRPSVNARILCDVLCVREETHGKLIDAMIRENGFLRVDSVAREVVRETWKREKCGDPPLLPGEFWHLFLRIAGEKNLKGRVLL